MDAEGPVHGGAVDADEHAVGHRGPRGIISTTVEAYLRNTRITMIVYIHTVTGTATRTRSYFPVRNIVPCAIPFKA